MTVELTLKLVCVVLGVYMILDGLGSILVYEDQPWWPDHFVRICRMVAGAIEIILGILL